MYFGYRFGLHGIYLIDSKVEKNLVYQSISFHFLSFQIINEFGIFVVINLFGYD